MLDGQVHHAMTVTSKPTGKTLDGHPDSPIDNLTTQLVSPSAADTLGWHTRVTRGSSSSPSDQMIIPVIIVTNHPARARCQPLPYPPCVPSLKVPLLSSMDYGDFSINVDEAFMPLALPHPTDQERTMQVVSFAADNAQSL
jgi:hypothetical protein